MIGEALVATIGVGIFSTTIAGGANDLAGMLTDHPSYVEATAAGWPIKPLPTTGEDFPRPGWKTGKEMYRFPGIPDGVGAYPLGGAMFLMVNHKFPKATVTRPNIKPDGTSEGDFSGVYVSRLLVDRQGGGVIGGKLAFHDIYQGGNRLGAVGDPKFALTRFCSGFIAGEAAAFGNWETSGVFDVSKYMGKWSWLFVVQAYSLNSLEASQQQDFTDDVKLGEGGQLLILTKGRG